MSPEVRGCGGRSVRRTGRHPADSGQATVELAILMPLVTVLLLAVIQVGLLGVRRVAVTSAAREGARVAAVTADTSEVREAAENALPGTLGIQVRVEGRRIFGKQVTVTVTDRVRPSVPIVSVLFPEEITLSAQARMAVEVP